MTIEELEAKLAKIVEAQKEVLKQAQTQLDRLAGAEAILREMISDLEHPKEAPIEPN